MIKNKRGISEIVATVLLIALTIIVAVIIFTWGTFFVSQTTEEVQETSSRNIACTDARFEVLSAGCKEGSANVGKLLNIVIENKADQDITGFIVRAHNYTNNFIGVNLNVQIPGGKLPPFSIMKVDYTPGGNQPSDVFFPPLLEIVPKITLDDGTQISCPAVLEEFNSRDFSLMGACGGAESMPCDEYSPDCDTQICNTLNNRCGTGGSNGRGEGWDCSGKGPTYCKQCVGGRNNPTSYPGPNSDCVINP